MVWTKHDENPLEHIGDPVEVDYKTGRVTRPGKKEDDDGESRTNEVADPTKD